MAEVLWIKLYKDVFNHSKIKQIRKLPEGNNIALIWFQVLCLAAETNDGGAIYLTQDIPYTDEMLATEFDHPITTIKLALSIFQSFNMILLHNELIMVSNWEKYQSVDKLEKIKEDNRRRVAQSRSKHLTQKNDNKDCNITVTLPLHIGNAIEEEVDKEIDKDCKDIKSVNEVGQSVARASKSDNKGGIELANYIGDNTELQEAVKQFIKMRKEIRKPMTDQAKSLLVKEMQKLEKSGENIIDCLNASILNSWQGLFPKRKQPLNKGAEVPSWIDTNIKPHIQIDDEVDIDELWQKLQKYK